MFKGLFGKPKNTEKLNIVQKGKDLKDVQNLKNIENKKDIQNLKDTSRFFIKQK